MEPETPGADVRDAATEHEADLRSRLEAALGSTYAIEGEIGGGGMARVFVAEERGLGRRVVIKVLPSGLAEGISSERFAREIKLAAWLQQANIVPVLTVGTAAGHPYYTMPFVEGRSLRERLAREGPLPIPDAVGILRDVARALAYAHARGVVHRDIKPANVLLSDRTAVVTDFGIAKALGEARSGNPRLDPPTQTGAGIGTPAYMAPEQAAGDPAIDHRADIYAFGCLAYELFTGRPPFSGSAPHQIITSHFQETPRPVNERRDDVPTEIADLIDQCLEKDPALRPPSADELLAILDAAKSRPGTRTRRQPRRSVGRVALVVSATVIVVAAVVYYELVRLSPDPLTIAVVPFRNAARDTALDYRSDGIGDEILNGIARLHGIQVVGRMAAYRYRDQMGVNAPDVATIERELGARLLVTGTLREDGGRVTISAQLHDAKRQGELWSQSFARDASQLGSVTDDIVKALTDVLVARYAGRIGRSGPTGAQGGTNDAAALDFYLLGQQQLRRRGLGVRQSVQSFERAIALDPQFARAHAALATALQLEPFFVGIPPSEVRDQTRSEARRALELDSTLADAHVALGGAHFVAGEWEMSDAEMERALELEPDNASARQAFARQLIVRGRISEAIDQLERARKVEATSPLIAAWISYAYFLAGRRDSALAESERAIQLDSMLLPATNLGALINLAVGRANVARRLVAATPRAGVMSNAPYVYAKLGDTATANRLVGAMESNDPRPWFTDVARASVSLAMGDSAGALSLLERSSRATGPLWTEFIPVVDPAFDLLRQSPRFAALLRQARLDPRRLRRREQSMR